MSGRGAGENFGVHDGCSGFFGDINLGSIVSWLEMGRVSRSGLSFEDLDQTLFSSEFQKQWGSRLKEFSSLTYFDNLRRLEKITLKKMFGGLAIYSGTRLMLILMESPSDYSYKDKKSDFPIWDGVLVATDHKKHPALKRLVRGLINHPVLPKWLYLQKSCESWEASAQKLSSLVAKSSPLIGVEKKKAAAPKLTSKIIPNLGKLTRSELRHVGISTFGDFKKLGWKKAWQRVVKKFPNRLNLNMGRALYGADKGKRWNELSANQVKEIREFQARMK